MIKNLDAISQSKYSKNIKLVNPQEFDKIFLKGEGAGAKPANNSTSKH